MHAEIHNELCWVRSSSSKRRVEYNNVYKWWNYALQKQKTKVNLKLHTRVYIILENDKITVAALQRKITLILMWRNITYSVFKMNFSRRTWRAVRECPLFSHQQRTIRRCFVYPPHQIIFDKRLYVECSAEKGEKFWLIIKIFLTFPSRTLPRP